MRKFVLDTNILLHYVRQSKLAQEVERELNLLSKNAIPMIASVSIGEMEGFMQRQQWGQLKINRLKKTNMLFEVEDWPAAFQWILGQLQAEALADACLIAKRVYTADEDWSYDVVCPVAYAGVFDEM